jgi:hypothetical protein
LAAWATFSRHVEHYDIAGVRHKIRIYNGLSSIMHLPNDYWVQSDEKLLPLWELLTNLSLWVIWKARNIAQFDNKQTPPLESVQGIRSELIHTLRLV